MSMFLVASYAADRKRLQEKTNFYDKKSNRSVSSESTRSSGESHSSRKTKRSNERRSSDRKSSESKKRYASRSNGDYNFEESNSASSVMTKNKSIFSSLSSGTKASSISGDQIEQENSNFVFTTKSMNILRYTYFEALDIDFDRIDREKNSQALHFNHFLNDNRDFDCPSKLGFMDDKINTALSSINKNKTFDYTLQLEDDIPEDKTSVRQTLKSKQFWLNVYDDIRIDSMSNSKAVFQQLPRRDLASEFFVEATDLFLYCFRFKKNNYYHLQNMNLIQLRKLTGNFCSDGSISYPTALSHAQCHQDCTSEDIMNTLTDRVIENLSGNLHGQRNTENFKLLFEIWKTFFQLIFSILFNYAYKGTDPELLSKPNFSL